MDQYLSKILKTWRLPTKKDLKVNNWEDIIIFRLNVHGWIRDNQRTKTVFGYKNFLDYCYSYWCEEYQDYSRMWGGSHTTTYKIDNTIAEFIQSNMKKIKWIWKLEETERTINDGYQIELYFSDLKEWIYFCYDQSYNYEWKNMKKLIEFKEKIDKMIWSNSASIL